ncbi:MAG: pantoate--beta-alanine ligase [Actinobacteria bacterium]|nr:pantoate--beta-alanine ligase [Actinomycetota bacterium]
MTARVVTTVAELAPSPGDSGPRVVVMTMGALHDGHGELVRAARLRAGSSGTVIVTVFVNPTQFGAGEDFARYPRTLDDDVALCSEAGADIVFAPSVVEVYGPTEGFGPNTITVDPGPQGDILEGASRQGHFRGTLTVVAKLMGMTRPDVALFGEKDYQQLVLIRRMASDLSMPVEIVGVPTVREPDGLARSSRNRYLSEDERRIAQVVPRALDAAAAAAVDGAQAAVTAGLAVLAAEPGASLDYLAVTDTDLGPAPAAGPARVLIAVKVGSTRLIDNRAATVGA